MNDKRGMTETASTGDPNKTKTADDDNSSSRESLSGGKKGVADAKHESIKHNNLLTGGGCRLRWVKHCHPHPHSILFSRFCFCFLFLLLFPCLCVCVCCVCTCTCTSASEPLCCPRAFLRSSGLCMAHAVQFVATMSIKGPGSRERDRPGLGYEPAADQNKTKTQEQLAVGAARLTADCCPRTPLALPVWRLGLGLGHVLDSHRHLPNLSLSLSLLFRRQQNWTGVITRHQLGTQGVLIHTGMHPRPRHGRPLKLCHELSRSSRHMMQQAKATRQISR